MKRLKSATVFLIALLPVVCMARPVGSTNIAVWESKTTGAQTIVDESGNLKTPNLTVTSNLTVDVGLTVAGDITANGNITGDGATIISNVVLVGDGSSVTNITLANMATLGDGTVVAGVATVDESMGEQKKTVITFTNVVLTVVDGAGDKGGNLKVYDFADGAVTLLSAVIDGVVVSSAGVTGTVLYVSVGTVAAGNDADLTSTEADIIPRTTIDQSAAGVTTNDFDAILAAPITFDGTSTSIDVIVNLAIADNMMDADNTNTFTGSLTLGYLRPVDNQ